MSRRGAPRRRARVPRWVLAAGGAALAGAVALGSCGAPERTTPVRVVVPPGATFRTAADSLARRGVVRSALLFRSWARLRGRDRAIKPGTYLLRPGSDYDALADALETGRGIVRVVTIVEGWDLRQIVPQLARSLRTPVDSVQAAVRDTALRRRLDVPTATLEGYLFPATYTFAEGTTARDAVAQMVARFEEAWQPAWAARLQAMAFTRHQAVTLASIVEKEARVPEERPVIAAVYYNRLRRGMRLQADPTVQYALPRHVSRVYYRDLSIDSPYNTYRNAGLPPGPIASPGAPSLRAAVDPADVPYLFFVAHPDGHHEFRTTYAEHTVAVRESRRLFDARATAADTGRASGREAPPPGRATRAPGSAPR